MNIIETIARYIIIIEFSTVALIIILAYLLKYIAKLRKNLKTKRMLAIREYFDTALLNRSLDDQSSFKSSWKKIESIVPVLQELNIKHNHSTWKHIRDSFCHTTLLPLARKIVSHPNWVKRFYAAQSFSLYYENQDAEHVFVLLNDPIALVFYASVEAAAHSHSQKCISKIISRLSHENWMTKSLFLQIFRQAPTTTRLLIERELKHASDPYVRATCYNMLMQFPGDKTLLNFENDLNSKDMNVKLAVLKYLAHVAPSQAIPNLTKYLKDEHWEIRTICARYLGQLDAKESISALASCLNDPDWWVRLACAQALHNLGGEGDKILEKQQEKTSPGTFNAAAHVLGRL